MNCRHCNSEVSLPLIDLGSAPPSNAYLTKSELQKTEKWFPLKVLICESCWLVQVEAHSNAAELFNDDYAYFSSFSSLWLTHTEQFVKSIVERVSLTPDSHVIEVASNDGYLLQYFKYLNIKCMGIEPTASTAAAARLKGIDTLEEFFGVKLAKSLVKQGKHADLMVANNVLAHVPDINDFTAGFSELLKPHGIATFEFPHLMQLIENNQFDTIYHEHFSYLSLNTINRIFNFNGLSVFDVEILETHGGSLRVFAQRKETGTRPISKRVIDLIDFETNAGLNLPKYYKRFQENANLVKNDFLSFLLNAKRSGLTVAAYGAAAKGNTLMNYAGIRQDLISFVVDRNPAKQGKFMPGSRIPIFDESLIHSMKPDFIVILPWNLKAEVKEQLKYIRNWGGKFVTAIPKLDVSS